jgi:hypothetical protein
MACLDAHLYEIEYKYRAIEIKKIEMALINILQLAARKNLIQMSLLIIDY